MLLSNIVDDDSYRRDIDFAINTKVSRAQLAIPHAFERTILYISQWVSFGLTLVTIISFIIMVSTPAFQPMDGGGQSKVAINLRMDDLPDSPMGTDDIRNLVFENQNKNIMEKPLSSQ